jgi:hypothetical protein
MIYHKKYLLICSGILLGATLLLIYVSNHLIFTKSLFDQSGNPLDALHGKDLAVFAKLAKSVYYEAIVYLLLKIFLIALIIFAALYLSGHPLAYVRVLHIVILSEFVFLLGALLKVIWFHFYYPQGTMMDWHSVYTLSLLTMFKNVPADWYYPLQTLNAFELGYWLLLGYGIAIHTRLTFYRSLLLVFASYVPALCAWITVVLFFTLLYFPTQS